MAARTLTSELIVRLIDQVSGPARSVSGALLGIERAANGKNFGNRLNDAIARNNAALNETRGQLFDAVAGFYALKSAIASPVKEAMAFESAMADVNKVVSFQSVEAFKAFQTQLMDLSKTVPMSVNGLAQIAAAAGQAGVAEGDLIKFTEAAAKIGVAFDISAEQAGDAMAKLQTALGMSLDDTVLLADSMNQLSNAQASSAADILDVVRRVGPMGKGFGFSATQTAAFASAMLSAGAKSDVAATSFQNMGLALVKGARASKTVRQALRDLGFDSAKVAKGMQEDAAGTVIKVLEAISKMPKDERAGITSELFGNNADALLALTNNIDLLKNSLGLVSDQSKYAGSAFKEFQVRAGTFQNAVQVFNNRLTALKIVIGSALIPALNDLMTVISPVIDRIASFADAHPQLTRNVLTAAAALVSFKIAVVGLKFVGLLGRGGALSLLSLGFNTVGRAAIGAAAAIRSAVALQTALGAMSGMKLTGLQAIGVAIRAMVVAVPGVSAIGAGLAAIGGALAAISAPAWLLIAGAVAAVAAAGFTLWKYWDRVSSVLSGFAGRIGQELKPALDLIAPAILPITEAFRGLGEAIGAGFDWAKQKVAEFGTWIGSFFSSEVLSDSQKAGFEKAGADVADAMINAIKSAFDGLLQWFTGLPARIVAAIGKIDLSSIIQWPSLNFSGPTSSGAVAQAPNRADAATGHRAGGGPVYPGSSFLVGERGREIFTPRSAGTITPAGRGGGNVTIGDIHVHEASDPQATAREVRKAIREEMTAVTRGVHADMGAR